MDSPEIVLSGKEYSTHIVNAICKLLQINKEDVKTLSKKEFTSQEAQIMIGNTRDYIHKKYTELCDWEDKPSNKTFVSIIEMIKSADPSSVKLGIDLMFKTNIVYKKIHYYAATYIESAEALTRVHYIANASFVYKPILSEKLFLYAYILDFSDYRDYYLETYFNYSGSSIQRAIRDSYNDE